MCKLLEPFNDKENWLIVADRRRQNVFQLNVDTGEIRAMLATPGTYPIAVAVSQSSLQRVFVAHQSINNFKTRGIKVLSFDGTLDAEVDFNGTIY